MSQYANWLIRTTSIFLVIPLTSLPECKITILGKQSQENERREVRIYAMYIQLTRIIFQRTKYKFYLHI